MTNKQDNKDKTRVYEYAKSIQYEQQRNYYHSKTIEIRVNNHMSVMENDAVSSVEKFFRDIKANAAAKRAATDGGNVSSSTTNQNPATQAPAQENKGAATPAAKPVASEPTTSQPTTATVAVTATTRTVYAKHNKSSSSTADQRPSGQGIYQGGQSSIAAKVDNVQDIKVPIQTGSVQAVKAQAKVDNVRVIKVPIQVDSVQLAKVQPRRTTTGYQGSNPGGQRPAGGSTVAVTIASRPAGSRLQPRSRTRRSSALAIVTMQAPVQVKAQVDRELVVDKAQTAAVPMQARTVVLAQIVSPSHLRTATTIKVEDLLFKKLSRSSTLVQQQLSWMMQQQKLA